MYSSVVLILGYILEFPGGAFKDSKTQDLPQKHWIRTSGQQGRCISLTAPWESIHRSYDHACSTKRGHTCPEPSPLARPTPRVPWSPLSCGRWQGRESQAKPAVPTPGLRRPPMLSKLILLLLSTFFEGKNANKKTQSSKGTQLFSLFTHLN